MTGVSTAEQVAGGSRTVRHVTFAMNPASLVSDVFGSVIDRLPGDADVQRRTLSEFDSEAALAVLRETEVLVTGWGAPRLDRSLLEKAPRLRAVLHFGGSLHHLAEPRELIALVESGVQLGNAGEANAVPVAEYTFAMMILAGKHARASEQLYRAQRAPIDRELAFPGSGNFRNRIGVIGASRIGRKVLELLRSLDADISVFDPSLSAEEIRALGASSMTLPELMTSNDIVSLHAPVTSSTVGMIDADLLRSLPTGATFINTSRGVLVDQDALIEELRTGRINAVLDVTWPEPLPAESQLWDLANVTLTPHIAGSMGRELHRLGEHVLAEIERIGRGEQLAFPEPPID